MRSYIKRVQNQARAASAIEAREKALNRPLKPWNPDLYHNYLYIECYEFCQQYKDHFEVARLVGHKRVLFAPGLSKYRILN